jgi:uncharacterized protein YdaU (DUF1376 family)
MAEFPALPLWTDAIVGDTQHLTTAEFGAYMLMLIVAWRTPTCDLPNDEAYLARITRLGKNWKRHRSILLAFWTPTDDGRLAQKRLRKERDFVHRQNEKQSRNARARWSQEAGVAQQVSTDSYSAGEYHKPGGKREPLTTPNELTNNVPDHATASSWHMPNGCQTDAPTPTPIPIKESKQEPPDALFESVPSPTKGNGHAKRKDAGTRLSRDWQPNPDDIAYAEQRGLDAGAVAEAFRDWWHQQPGAKGVKLDWHATWRTWCRREAEKRGAADQRRGAGQGPVGETAAIFRVLDRRKN